MNIHVQDFEWTYAFSSQSIPLEVELQPIWVTARLYPKQLYHSKFPLAAYEGFNFLTNIYPLLFLY